MCQPIILAKFSSNCMKLKKNWSERGHGSLESESGLQYSFRDNLNNNCSRKNENKKYIHRKNEDW